MIERVEKLSPELDAERIPDRKVFEDAHVIGEEARSAKLTFADVAERSYGWKRKGSCVEPATTVCGGIRTITGVICLAAGKLRTV